MWGFLLTLFLLALEPSLPFPCIVAFAVQDATVTNASTPGDHPPGVDSYTMVEENATLILIGDALRYVYVAPKRYVRMVHLALQDDLSRCFCYFYLQQLSLNLAEFEADPMIPEGSDVNACKMSYFSLFPGFNDDPEELAVYFTATWSMPLRDYKKNPVGHVTRLILPQECFTGLQRVLAKLAGRSGRQPLQRRTVFVGIHPSSIMKDSSNVLSFHTRFCGVVCGLAIFVLVISGLMVLVTVLFMSCRRWNAEFGLDEELGQDGAVGGVIDSDHTRRCSFSRPRSSEDPERKKSEASQLKKAGAASARRASRAPAVGFR
ncbi:hypothetical protein MOQ_010053 [Trypanosoma cruzi marinkellei]|uniref:Uncharacterized protein n=1 Tax=Trypanosoma cruzi marinkellei TaxID=85056 RepID=K2MGK7_TRYCR|nr:hypothetical protein MOQ_010053 [Trypanosoma cruzi marinkellei]